MITDKSGNNKEQLWPKCGKMAVLETYRTVKEVEKTKREKECQNCLGHWWTTEELN